MTSSLGPPLLSGDAPEGWISVPPWPVRRGPTSPAGYWLPLSQACESELHSPLKCGSECRELEGRIPGSPSPDRQKWWPASRDSDPPSQPDLPPGTAGLVLQLGCWAGGAHAGPRTCGNPVVCVDLLNDSTSFFLFLLFPLPACSHLEPRWPGFSSWTRN